MEPPTVTPGRRSDDHLEIRPRPPTQQPMRTMVPVTVMTAQAPVAPRVGDTGATAAIQGVPTIAKDPPNGPAGIDEEHSLFIPLTVEDNQPQPSSHPLVGMEEPFVFEDADEWLNNMINLDDNGSSHSLPITGPSPLTSMATETRTGNVFKGCKCPSHQEIYNDWPTHNAELTIAVCMKTCVYCGKDFSFAAELRKHMRKRCCSRRNIEIRLETKGRFSASTPAWTARHLIETPSHRANSEPLLHPSDTRVTRSQSLTHGINIGPH